MKPARVCTDCGQVYRTARICPNHEDVRSWTEPTQVDDSVHLVDPVFEKQQVDMSDQPASPAQGEEVNGRWVPRLYTARYQEFRPEWGVPVRTSIGKPKMSLDYTITDDIGLLMPFGLLGDGRSREDFERGYIARLDRAGRHKLQAIFRTISEKHDRKALVLLCYEDLRRGQWCHRRMFAEWWWQVAGSEVVELLGPERRRPSSRVVVPSQAGLF